MGLPSRSPSLRGRLRSVGARRFSPHPLAWLSLGLLPLLSAGCGDIGCLSGKEGCRLPSPCAGLQLECPTGGAPGAAASASLELRELGGEATPGGSNALASRGDVLLGNDQVVAVVAGLGNQNALDPSGGSLLDLGSRGRDNDGLNQVLQVVGILPRDAVSYTQLQLIDERPTRVAVQVRGTLYEQPAVSVSTLYELRPCEPGLRIRTELWNGSADPQLWALADGYYWSGKELLPFTPERGGGFTHPSFDLLSIDDAYTSAPYLAASTHTTPAASYAVVGCNTSQLEGFHSDQVSAMGLPQTVVPPREHLVFERFLATAPRGDVAGAVDLALELRRQLYGERHATVTGKIAAPVGSQLEGFPFPGEQVSVLVSEGTAATPPERRVPTTQVLRGADGSFSARVPAGRSYVLEVHAFGRKVAERETRVDGDLDLGVLAVPAAGALTVRVRDALGDAPLDAQILLVPADAATRQALAGSFHGRFPGCAPWLGGPHGPSPACNRLLVWSGDPAGATIAAPPGRYHVYAYHGPFFSLARQTVDLAEGELTLDFHLSRLSLLPTRAVSADLHVHGAASFDSAIPDLDRVLSFAAADVDVVIATDHDVVYDYGAMVEQLGLGDRMSTVTGVETTGHILFMEVPGSSIPKVIGHYNLWPLRYDPTLPRNGGPFDELVEPGALFDRVEPLFTGLPLIELNHPWAEPEFGRDLGFPRALGLDLTADLPTSDDGSAAGMYVRRPAGGHYNNDHHAQEVMNGTANELLLAYRAFWFYGLNQGQLKTGTANSDSHGLTDNVVGSPRNLVFTDTLPGRGFDLGAFNQAVRDGAVLGTNGPMITAVIRSGADELPFGMKPQRPAADAKLYLEVSAAPWVPVEEIRIVVNGQVVKTLGKDALQHPADPFGTAGLLRYQGELPLSDFLPASGDAWLVVEAGRPLPLWADLGGGEPSEEFPNGRPDGIPDTGDNNGDGKVDRADVALGEDVGPLPNPKVPEDDGDPWFHFAQVVPEGYPAAFTNPFVLDRDGDGVFTSPGAKGVR